MLDAEPDDAIGMVFESLGATGTASTALDDVLAAALGTKPRPELAGEHAIGRLQFGRPVASFQAVRHRLAEALVALEALDATLRAATDQPSVTTAALAKATAGRTLHRVATHCQQVLAGIGFTTDHAFHRFLKRAMVLEGLFGSADGIAIDLGRRLLATRSVPTLIDL